MIVNKINFGELNSIDEMWQICDAISAAHAGLPDSLLKEALLFMLESQRQMAENNSWYRGQLDRLLRL